ncbi:MAG: transposase [Phyllobacterium sp.]|nr:transposase [Phyllobacterium sp.]
MLDELDGLIAWKSIATFLGPLCPATKGEPGWPPLAALKALLLSVWYDLSDVKLAEALDDRASFRSFCGFSRRRRRRSAPLSWKAGRAQGRPGFVRDRDDGGRHRHRFCERGGR